MALMADRGTDFQTRKRITAWTRYLMGIHSIETGAELARRLGLSEATISLVLRGDRTPGLDFVLKLHRVFFVSLDAIVDSDPPARSRAGAPPKSNAGDGRR